MHRWHISGYLWLYSILYLTYMTFGTERYLGKVRTYVLICNNFEGLRGKSQNRHTRIKYRKTGIRREAAASNYFHEIFGQDLLSKK